MAFLEIILKFRWQPPQGHPCLEVFISQVENELFELRKGDIKYSNLSREDWNAIRSLADDRNIIIKKAYKGLCILIWGGNDYLTEVEKQGSDKKVYEEVSIVKTFYVRGHSHMESSHSLHQNGAKLQTHPRSTLNVKMPNLPKIDVYSNIK